MLSFIRKSFADIQQTGIYSSSELSYVVLIYVPSFVFVGFFVPINFLVIMHRPSNSLEFIGNPDHNIHGDVTSYFNILK